MTNYSSKSDSSSKNSSSETDFSGLTTLSTSKASFLHESKEEIDVICKLLTSKTTNLTEILTSVERLRQVESRLLASCQNDENKIIQLTTKIDLESERKQRLIEALHDAEKRHFVVSKERDKMVEKNRSLIEIVEELEKQRDCQYKREQQLSKDFDEMEGGKEARIKEMNERHEEMIVKLNTFQSELDAQIIKMKSLEGELSKRENENQELTHQLGCVKSLFDEMDCKVLTGNKTDNRPITESTTSGISNNNQYQDCSRTISEGVVDEKQKSTSNKFEGEISISKTFLKLKEMIMEKKKLVNEIERLKSINKQLIINMTQRENKLCSVTDELNKTWQCVSTIKLRHKDIKNKEAVLKAELLEKQQILKQLREELNDAQNNWNFLKDKTSQCECTWKMLHDEFTSRKEVVSSSLPNDWLSKSHTNLHDLNKESVSTKETHRWISMPNLKVVEYISNINGIENEDNSKCDSGNVQQSSINDDKESNGEHNTMAESDEDVELEEPFPCGFVPDLSGLETSSSSLIISSDESDDESDKQSNIVVNDMIPSTSCLDNNHVQAENYSDDEQSTISTSPVPRNSAGNIRRVLLKHLPQHLENMRSEKSRMEERIVDLETTVSQFENDQREMERRKVVAENEVKRFKKIIDDINMNSTIKDNQLLEIQIPLVICSKGIRVEAVVNEALLEQVRINLNSSNSSDSRLQIDRNTGCDGSGTTVLTVQCREIGNDTLEDGTIKTKPISMFIELFEERSSC